MTGIAPKEDTILHPKIITLLRTRKIKDLYPPQWEGIQAGISGQNIILSIPTASGKTLIAEILALQRLLALQPKQQSQASKKRQKILYLCPLKALASEKYEEFKDAWATLGFRVGISTSDIDRIDYKVFTNDLIILTNEKADALLRLDPKRMASLSMVICDEIHLINDESRGITLEFLLTRIKTANPRAQIIGLSATIKNAEELATWLDAKLITSDWRPVELKEGFYLKDEIHFQDGTVRRIPKIPKQSEVTTLAIDMIKEGGQVLVFTNSRKNTLKLAESLYQPIRIVASKNEKISFTAGQEKFAQIDPLETESAKKMHKFLKGGVAFHHAGLPRSTLSFLVDQFNHGKIKVICCTPTLAAGVNTPARRVIIKTLYRYNAEKGNVLIPVIEYKQMAGRAGRPRFDPYGEVVILGSNPEKLVNDAVAYINGDLEKIYSKIGDNDRLQSHILSLVVSKFAQTSQEILAFLKNTFYYTQLQTGTLTEEAPPPKRRKLTKNTHKKSRFTSTRPKSNIKEGRGEDPLGLSTDTSSYFTTASNIWDTVKASEDLPHTKEHPDQKLKIENHIRTKIQTIVSYFLKNDLVEKQEDPSTEEEQLRATKFGKVCSQSYLSPMDAIIIKEDLLYASVLAEAGELSLTPTSWLGLLSKLSAFRKFYLRKQDYIPVFAFIEDHAENFIMEEVWAKTDPQFLNFAQEIKLTMIMHDWISEVHEKNITERYNIGIGDIHNTRDNAKWLIRAMQQISDLDPDLNFKQDLQHLYFRMNHGIRASLIPLVELKGIGRVRARKLFQAGFHTQDQLEAATIEEIAKVPLIGLSLATNIQTQITNGGLPPRRNKKTSSKKKRQLAKVEEEEIKHLHHSEEKDDNVSTKEEISKKKRKNNTLDWFF